MCEEKKKRQCLCQQGQGNILLSQGARLIYVNQWTLFMPNNHRYREL